MTNEDQEIEDFFNNMVKKESRFIKKTSAFSQRKKAIVRERKIPEKNVAVSEKKEKVVLPEDPYELYQTLHPSINQLRASELSTRIQAIKRIKPAFGASKEGIRVIFHHSYQVFIEGLQDEKNIIREPLCKFLARVMKECEFPKWENSEKNDFFDHLFPILANRFSINPKNQLYTESTEEIRLVLIEMIRDILLKYPFQNYLSPICSILPSALNDKSGKIKVIASECTEIVCNQQASLLNGHEVSAMITDAILPNLTHNKWEVRMHALKAFYEVGKIKPSNEMEHPIKKVKKILRHLATDDNPKVRETVIDVCKNWWLDDNDTGSFSAEYVCPILIIHSDLIPELQSKAYQAMKEISDRKVEWELERDFKFKEKLDYLTNDEVQEELSHLQFPFEKSIRPELGSRVVVKGAIKYILSVILESSTVFDVKTKETSADLLSTTICYVEKDITQDLQKLISKYWLERIDDSEQTIMEKVARSVRIAGRYCGPNQYLPIIFTYLEAKYATASRTVSKILLTLIQLLSGIVTKHQDQLRQSLSLVVNTFQQSHLLYHEDVRLTSILEKSIESLMMALKGSLTKEDCLPFLLLTCRLMGQPDRVHLLNEEDSLFSKFVDSFQFNSIQEIFECAFEVALNDLLQNSDSWTKHNQDLYAFEYLITKGMTRDLAEKYGKYILSQLKRLSQSSDGIVRSKAFSVIEFLFETQREEAQSMVEEILKDLITPNLQWKFGKDFAVTRSLGFKCLLSIMESGLLTGDMKSYLVKDSHQKIISALDEDNFKIRSTANKLLDFYLSLCHEFIKEEQDWITLSLALIERFNDSEDSIRVQSIRNAEVLLTYFPPQYRNTLAPDVDALNDIKTVATPYDVEEKPKERYTIIEAFLRAIFIHLDDGKLQHELFEVLRRTKNVEHFYHNTISAIAKENLNKKFFEADTKSLHEKLMMQ